MSENRTNCFKLILGPLGTVVGSCELEFGHKGPCRVNGVSEQDMVDTLTGLNPERTSDAN